jgi:hypothetical protein
VKDIIVGPKMKKSKQIKKMNTKQKNTTNKNIRVKSNRSYSFGFIIGDYS